MQLRFHTYIFLILVFTMVGLAFPAPGLELLGIKRFSDAVPKCSTSF